MAIARPMPEPAPVTTAMWEVSRGMDVVSVRLGVSYDTASRALSEAECARRRAASAALHAACIHSGRLVEWLTSNPRGLGHARKRRIPDRRVENYGPFRRFRRSARRRQWEFRWNGNFPWRSAMEY